MSVHDFDVATADGGARSLQSYEGQVLLIVNVASECGFTPQYEGLESLFRTYHGEGFQVLGFPCNQFGGQEPGSEEQIAAFCQSQYDVTFPVFAKIDVNGDQADPLYRYLRASEPGHLGPEAGFLYEHLKENDPEALDSDAIKWNFTKFLVGRSGDVIARFESHVTPAEIDEHVAAALAT